jgi:hypothetical protein
MARWYRRGRKGLRAWRKWCADVKAGLVDLKPKPAPPLPKPGEASVIGASSLVRMS